MNTEDRITIASVSKTMTAITLLKLLDEKQISVDSSIKPYLPKDLTLHDSIQGITFRQLLTHTSGLRDSAEPSYAVLKAELAAGVKSEDKVQKYQNGNFGMMRLLIPTIEDGFVPTGAGDDYARSYLYGIRTMQATQKRIFAPVGIGNVFCNNPAADECLSYQYPGPVKAGQDWGDMTATNAYRGWVLTAGEMSKVIRGLLYSEKLMTKEQREKMLTGRLGIWHDDVADLDEFSHGGWHPGSSNAGEVGTVIVGYSNGVSVALFVNSQIGGGDSTLTAIRSAVTQDVAANK